jgi:hypothetical protein
MQPRALPASSGAQRSAHPLQSLTHPSFVSTVSPPPHAGTHARTHAHTRVPPRCSVPRPASGAGSTGAGSGWRRVPAGRRQPRQPPQRPAGGPQRHRGRRQRPRAQCEVHTPTAHHLRGWGWVGRARRLGGCGCACVCMCVWCMFVRVCVSRPCAAAAAARRVRAPRGPHHAPRVCGSGPPRAAELGAVAAAGRAAACPAQPARRARPVAAQARGEPPRRQVRVLTVCTRVWRCKHVAALGV